MHVLEVTWLIFFYFLCLWGFRAVFTGFVMSGIMKTTNRAKAKIEGMVSHETYKKKEDKRND